MKQHAPTQANALPHLLASEKGQMLCEKKRGAGKQRRKAELPTPAAPRVQRETKSERLRDSIRQGSAGIWGSNFSFGLARKCKVIQQDVCGSTSHVKAGVKVP